MEINTAAQVSSTLLIKFVIDEDSFGIDIGNVREIIEIPPLTKVPTTPDYFVGIVNLRGEVISVIDMRVRFGLKPKKYDELSRIAVIYFKGGYLGLIVDDVNEVVRISNDMISDAPPILQNIDTAYLRGVAEDEDGHMLLLLDLETIVNLADFAQGSEDKKIIASDYDYKSIEKKEEEIHIITFKLESELYAINIQDSEEIVTKLEITPIPQAPDFIKGVISLRGNIIPIVDLHVRFHCKPITVTDDTSIIIVDVGSCMIGLIVDSIAKIIHVPKSLVTAPPPTLSKDDVKQLFGVIKLEDADKSQIISYISLNELFTAEELALLSEVHDDKRKGEEDKKARLKDEEIVVVNFIVGDDIFTIPVNIIIEISKYPAVTRVPNSPEFVEGVINLRGDVIFLIDMRSRFGFERMETGEDTRVIIADIEGIKTGLIVDAVDSVKKLYKSQLEPAPKIISNIENEYISSVIKLKDKEEIMIMLNLFSLLNKSEKTTLRSIDVEELKKAGAEEGVQQPREEAKPETAEQVEDGDNTK